MNKLIIAILLLIQIVYSQTTTSTRVLGIGVGTFIIIIAVIFSVIWCLACRNSSKPELYSILGLLVPGILIIVFIFTPKTSQISTTSTITDPNYIPHFLFMTLSLVGFLIPCLFLMVNDSFAYRKAKNVARAAFIMREEQQQALVNQPARSQLQLQSNAQTQNMAAP